MHAIKQTKAKKLSNTQPFLIVEKSLKAQNLNWVACMWTEISSKTGATFESKHIFFYYKCLFNKKTVVVPNLRQKKK